MGVLFQAFYWNCPSEENQDGTWWNFVAGKIPELQQAGFTALWLPPASKAANLGGPSMGYDPYDYYDLGDFNQKGRTKTWFGNQAELVALINEAHTANMQVYADLVLDHNNGGDAQEPNPIDGQTRWTKFNPGSGKFPRDWQCFHPSPFEIFDEMTFGDMPDLCHRHPLVYQNLIELGQWLVETIGFDGFRFDFVKGYAPWMVQSLAELRYLKKSGDDFYAFCVGECWDNERTVDDWLGEVNSDKLLAYSFILTHEGYPSVFWMDWYNFGLAKASGPNGIAALVAAHEQHAGGTTQVLYADDNLYVMQRTGAGYQPGLVYVLNNLGSAWNGAMVQTQWRGVRFEPVAYGGYDTSRPDTKMTSADGFADFWAGPRGWAVYAPQL